MIDAHRVTLGAQDDFDGWREAARGLAEAGVPPGAVIWQVEGGASDLFGEDSKPTPAPSFAVPRAFVNLARDAICHSDPERFSLLFAMLWKLRFDREAIANRADPLVARVESLAKEVRRDVHKMHAFVRFRELDDPAGGIRLVAYFEPQHHIVRKAAPFFVDRFANMRWSILTPELSVHWDGETLVEVAGARRAEAPSGDPLEEMWCAYYASIFNPARLKVGAMMKEMPKKYWRNMPETSLIQPLIAGARARELEMINRSTAEPDERRIRSGSNVRIAWEELVKDARDCRRCNLYRCSTQTVFGEGPHNAKVVLVGEQPGDMEDLAGRPFVGPAGKLLDEALASAGIDRSQTYVTNAVKHFKFVRRGKRRIHSKPDAGEIEACRWWLEQERELIRPAVTVALGTTAARSLLGKTVTISRARNEPLALPDGGECWVTVHPSFLLRIPDEARRREERDLFVRDLERIKARADELANSI